MKKTTTQNCIKKTKIKKVYIRLSTSGYFRFLSYYLAFCFTIQTYFFAFAQTSVLREGRWFKIGVTQTGVYKIDAAFLRKMGVNPTEVNPKYIRLFGNGGAILPQLNKALRATDLIENAVLVKGENDGRFDE